MAIELQATIVRATDGLSISYTDTTGVYNVSTNPGGYGTPNPAVGQFSDFNISVYLPDPVTLLPSATPVVINAYPSLPSSSGATFELTSLLLLGDATTVLIDGWYVIEVDATYNTGSEGSVTLSYDLIMFEIVDCCITNMTVKSIDCGCSGGSEKIRRLVKANLMLDQFRTRTVNGLEVPSPLVNCEQYTEAVNLLHELQTICENGNCRGCG